MTNKNDFDNFSNYNDKTPMRKKESPTTNNSVQRTPSNKEEYGMEKGPLVKLNQSKKPAIMERLKRMIDLD